MNVERIAPNQDSLVDIMNDLPNQNLTVSSFFVVFYNATMNYKQQQSCKWHAFTTKQ